MHGGRRQAVLASYTCARIKPADPRHTCSVILTHVGSPPARPVSSGAAGQTGRRCLRSVAGDVYVRTPDTTTGEHSRYWKGQLRLGGLMTQSSCCSISSTYMNGSDDSATTPSDSLDDGHNYSCGSAVEATGGFICIRPANQAPGLTWSTHAAHQSAPCASERTQEQNTGAGNQLHTNGEPLALTHTQAVAHGANNTVSHLRHTAVYPRTGGDFHVRKMATNAHANCSAVPTGAGDTAPHHCAFTMYT
jgi:hypothetical protein